MDRTPVSSSNIAAVGYDFVSLVLEVEFTNGRVYQYLDVPSGHYQAMTGAGSVGTYFNQNVKPYYRCVPA
ncbi:KTSC domain-containing protein [Blastococcus sp. SYSU DS1021]